MFSDYRDYSFGANFRKGSGTTFRLWAPDYRNIDLLLRSPEGEEICVRLEPSGEGFFGYTSPRVTPGWRYRYLIDGEGPFPDPASRFQPDDVHGNSEVVDSSYTWTDQDWTGQHWANAVIYELHVGTFTPEGTFRGILSKLDYLQELGVTALELMPVADFPGGRNWGYDGTFLYAPDSRYGSPEDLKCLVDNCHARGLGVILDVVYNHFGPNGNYLWPISRRFFNSHAQTPWGESINIAHPIVTAFFKENASFWIQEYHMDGLRLDAVHALDLAHRQRFLMEIRTAASAAARNRSVFLILENPDNQAELLRDSGNGAYDAQWSDDFQHAVHKMITGEQDGRYQDHVFPDAAMVRSIQEGFTFQGEYSQWRGGPRGTPTTNLNLEHFVYFIQNHDTVGNRAIGERLNQLVHYDVYCTAVALYLFLPGIPMLFMGEEFCASTPFLFFVDQPPELAARIRDGRIRQHEAYSDWRRVHREGTVPDPQDINSFLASKLDWSEINKNAHTLQMYKKLIELRSNFIPLIGRGQEDVRVEYDNKLLTISLRDRLEIDILVCIANFGPERRSVPTLAENMQAVFYTKPLESGKIAARSAVWLRRID